MNEWLCLDCRSVTVVHDGKLYIGCEHYRRRGMIEYLNKDLEDMFNDHTLHPQVKMLALLVGAYCWQRQRPHDST